MGVKSEEWISRRRDWREVSRTAPSEYPEGEFVVFLRGRVRRGCDNFAGGCLSHPHTAMDVSHVLDEYTAAR